MNTKRETTSIRIIFRKVTSIVLTLALFLCGIPLMKGVDEVHGADKLTTGVASLAIYLNDVKKATWTVDLVEFESGSNQININNDSVDIPVPAGSTGTVKVDVTYNGVTGGGIAFGGAPVAGIDSATIAYATTVAAKIAFEYQNTSGDAVNVSGDIPITFKEEIPESPWKVTVNGADCPTSHTPLEGSAQYIGAATVDSPKISVAITSGGAATSEYSLVGAGTAITPESPGNFTLPSEGKYAIKSNNGQLEVTITYAIPPPPSSGGSGGSPPPINVVNQENKPNESSDNILTPLNTTESGGTSSTDVTGREIAALLDMAEKHKEDVPNGENEGIIKIEDKKEGITEYNVTLSQSDSDKLAASSLDAVTVKTSIGDFRLKTDEMSALININKGSMKFQMIKINHKGRPGIDAKLMIGNILVTQLETGYGVEIRVPYTPKEGEDTSALFIEYIDDLGKTHTITESRYEKETGCLVFFATHLSKYGVSYNPRLFKDVKSTHWASGAITFLAARKVINGREDGTFRPDDKVTKAEFITMMTKAFSAASLGKKTVKSYKDVPLDAWYAKAVGWSYLNNISNVIAKNGRFNPQEPLSREDMATLSNNISIGLNLKLKEKKPARNFKDSKAIAGYAKGGVERMSKCGIVSGNSSGNFMPKASLTRAEGASVISTLMAGMK